MNPGTKIWTYIHIFSELSQRYRRHVNNAFVIRFAILPSGAGYGCILRDAIVVYYNHSNWSACRPIYNIGFGIFDTENQTIE